MKNSIIIFVMILSSLKILGQNKNQVVIFNENYDAPSEWTIYGNVTIDNSRCNLNNVAGASYHKAYKAIGNELPNEYWQSEIKFHINSTNPDGKGTGGTLLALTAGSLDVFSYDASQSYMETNQDGIAVVLISGSEFDENINNWKFIIEAKKGNIRTYTNTGISASSSIFDYYISLTRENESTVSLCVYEDPQKTIHRPGSPLIFNINSSIANLTHVQHGSITHANSARILNGYIDSLKISTIMKDSNSCAIYILQNDFTNSNDWSLIGNSTVSGGQLSFNAAEGGTYHKAYKELSRPLSNSYWKSEIELILPGNNPVDEGVGASIMAFTAGQLDFSTTSLADGLTETNQDAIAAILTSSTMFNNNISNWKLKIQSKKGDERISSNSEINLNSTILHYYVRLERMNETEVKLSVFSDANFSQHIVGSPIYTFINPSISNLNTVQIGSLTEGSYHRVFYGALDNLTSCDDNSNTNIDPQNTSPAFTIFPNPFNTITNISFSQPTYIESVLIYNTQGELIYKSSPKEKKSDFEIQLSNFAKGPYFVLMLQENGEYMSNTIVKIDN